MDRCPKDEPRAKNSLELKLSPFLRETGKTHWEGWHPPYPLGHRRVKYASQFKRVFNPIPHGVFWINKQTRDSKMRVLAQTTTFLPLLWYTNAVDEN